MARRLPSVTVLVCAFDYERYVAEALDSALAQDYAGPVEVLVVDDGSTDRTPQILAGYGDRIRVVRQPNAGLNAATARGIAEAQGDLVALLDADDVWRADKLRRQVELLAGRPEVGLVFCDMALVDADGAPLAPSYFRRHGMRPPRGRVLGALLAENLVPAPTIAFRRALAGHVLPVADAASFQDWWLALKVAEVAELDWVDEPLVSYRVHGDNMASGAAGGKWARNVRADLRFRRWMPAHLDLGAVVASDLRRAVEALDRDALTVARRTGGTVDAELAAGAEERAAWAHALIRARAARASGDRRAAALAALAAVAADPTEPDARAELADLLDRLEADEAAPGQAPFVATVVQADDPAARLVAAEEAFGRGDVAAARRQLRALAGEPGLAPELAAQAGNDLAVIAAAAGDLESARREALAAAALDPGYAPAAETLGRCAEAERDLVQAEHWFARALRLDPGEPSLAEALSATRAARRPGRAGDTAPAAAAPARRGRALICVDYFHPSVGGSERLAEQIGARLRGLGWHVEVATRALRERVRREHAGMRIHEIRADPPQELAAIVRRGGYDAILALSDPRAWPVPAVCSLPDGSPRRVVVPCINPENLAHLLADDDRLAAHLELVRRADVHVHSSRTGLDARLAERLGLDSVYVPNGADRLPPGGDADVPDGAPLALVVGNLWPEKNHIGLLSTLGGREGDWRLALIGAPAPGRDTLAARVHALAAADPRVHVAGALPPARVAAAMRQADVLLLPSLAEATPLVLVEAMAHGLPWIATPRCGAAHDHAGGLILPVRDFGDGLDHLLSHPADRAALGAAGRAHWEAAYRWEVVGARYDALLSGADRLPDLPPPTTAIARTDAVRAAQLDALVDPIPVTPALEEAMR